MNIYDIALTIVCFIILSTLFKIVDYFKNKIKELDDEIEKLYMLNDINDSNLKNFEDNLYTLMDVTRDEIINKKNEDYNDKADKKIGAGKWIRIESDGTYGLSYWYACSICHNKAPKNQYGIEYFSSYCPTCGAKMEFESEVNK